MFKRLRRALYLSAFIGWGLSVAPLHADPILQPPKDCRDIQALLGQMPPEAEDLFQTVHQQAIAWGEQHKREPPQDSDLPKRLSMQTREAARLYLRQDIAENYDSWFFFHQFVVLEELFAKLFFPISQTSYVLPSARSVLILGTGTGIDVEALSAVLPLRSGHTRVVGVDYSQQMLRHAAARIKRLGLSQYVKLLLYDLLNEPDVVTEARLARSLQVSPEAIRVDLILSMACLGQHFDHIETVGIIRNWIAPYLKLGGKLGFAVASKDELAFPSLQFTEYNLAEHPWVKMLKHFGIYLTGIVPIKGKTQTKYFLTFERMYDQGSARRLVTAAPGDVERVTALQRERPTTRPVRMVFPDSYYEELRRKKEAPP